MPPRTSLDLANLVRKLGDASQTEAHQKIEALCRNRDDPGIHAAVVAAGAIPLLLQLLEPGSATLARKSAAATLTYLARTPEIAVAITTAGAIPRLVQLLEPGSEVQRGAAGVLSNLALNSQNRATIAAAGAIPRLVQMLGSGSPDAVQCRAAVALMSLAMLAENAVTIAAAGATPLLVQLLSGPPNQAQRAAGALRTLTGGPENTDNKVTIAAAGAIPLLMLLLAPGLPALAQDDAVGALWNLATVLIRGFGETKFGKFTKWRAQR
ncbi:hypothetical protein FOA52_002177 [Chlamydomonas sp. UWO 241]|nr:hypothetical protein FOA52_002177 [Chlamydomonas sp. UWO 241]